MPNSTVVSPSFLCAPSMSSCPCRLESGKKGGTKIAGRDRRLGLDEAGCRDPRRPEREGVLGRARGAGPGTRDTEREGRGGDDTTTSPAPHVDIPSFDEYHQPTCPNDMSETITVRFLDLKLDRMPANDVLLLRRRLPPLELNCIQSEEQFKRFQAFVRKNKEDTEKRKEEEAEHNTSQPIAPWQREFMDEITDRPTLNSWMKLAVVTTQPDLLRICIRRGEELDELGIVEDDDDDDDGYQDDSGDHYVYGGLDMYEPVTDDEDANGQVDDDDLYYLGISDDDDAEVGNGGSDDAGGDSRRAGPLMWDSLWNDDPPQ